MAEEGGIRIIWQTTVVDIQPTSRWTTEGAPDTANVETTIQLERPAESIGELFPGAEVDMREGGLALVRQRVDVEGTEDRYSYRLTVPTSGTEIVKNGDYSVLVLLPRPGAYPTGPVYAMRLVEWPRDPEPVIFGVKELAPLAGRIALAWHERADPDDPIKYIYDTIRSRG